ncbi:MAG: hypothetical protein AAF485_11610 [Chloroflexota bacterium]
MASKRLRLITLSWIILVFPLLACQILGAEEADDITVALTDTGPIHSDFVTAKETLRVDVGQEIEIKSHHISQNQLANLAISVNQQPIAEDATGQTIFPPDLATVEFLIDGQPVRANVIEPPYPISTWNVAIRWVGHKPGVYLLRLTATDGASNVGDPIVQRILVK